MKRVIVVCLCLCLTLCGCSFGGDTNEESRSWFEKETQTKEPDFVPDEVPDQQVVGWYYDSLQEEEERETYRQILHAIETHNTDEVHLTSKNPDRITEIYQYIVYDHPELFWLDNYELYTYQVLNTVVGYGFKGNYTVDKAEVEQIQTNLETKAEAVIAQAPMDGDDYEKVKFVYESIIRNTEYDMDSPDNQNIRSVLENGVSVCQGYALTMQYLLEKLGVTCITVSGMADGIAHAWNIVWVDGEAYWLDATWGDPQFEEGSSEKPEDFISYDYMLVPAQKLASSHVPDALFPLPECNSTAANYYVKEGLYIETWDPEHFQALVNRSLLDGSGEWTMLCAEEGIYHQLIQMLLDEQEIYPYLKKAEKETGCDFNTDRIQYSLDEGNCKIQFQLVFEEN